MHLSHNNIEAIAEVADEILGCDHPVTCLIRAIHTDPALAHEAWAAIEALPEFARKAIAGMVAQRLNVHGGSTALH